jgi:hypothetical protein
MNAAIEAKKLAIVITITSRFWMWVSSWPSTPSSSAGASRLSSPARRAPDRERVGHGRLRDRDPRLGEVGLDAQPVDYRVQLRRLARLHLPRPHRQQRDLVGREELEQEQRAGDHRDGHRARAGGDQNADQQGVDEPEQEHRQQHPRLEARIASE